MKSTIIGVLLAIVVLVGLTAFAIFYFSDRWNEPDLGNEVLVEAEEIPVEEIPAEEVPVEEAPTEKTPVEETPVEEIPAEKTPVEDPNSHLSLIYFRNNPVTKYSIEQPEGYDLTGVNP